MTKAIILAAGRGSRMQDMTQNKPKGMVEFFGKPLVQYQLDAIMAAGIDDIHIVTGYSKKSYEFLDVAKINNPEWANTNMVSSLICADSILCRDSCIISYSDIFYEQSHVATLMKSLSGCSITYDPKWDEIWEGRFADPLSDAENFKLDRDGFLQEIGGRPISMKDVQGQYMGLLKFTPVFWSKAKELFSTLAYDELCKLDMTSFLNQMILRGESVRAIPISGSWGEVDSQADLTFYENSSVYKKRWSR